MSSVGDQMAELKRIDRARAVLANGQDDIAEWVLSTLGPIVATNVHERSLRATEEAIELAQACGVDAPTVHRLVDYVFGRPAGDPAQEIAGTLVALYAVATALSVEAAIEFEKELARIRTPEVIERVRRRQAEKREALQPKALDGEAHDEWTEIGKRCSAGRRSMWMRLVFRDPSSTVVDPASVKAIQLRAGREGNDSYMCITSENPQFAELLDLFLTAHFAATT